MTLEELRLKCGYSKRELARLARVDYNTLLRAMNGETVSLNTANRLSLAISQGLGREIRIQDIDGLVVGR